MKYEAAGCRFTVNDPIEGATGSFSHRTQTKGRIVFVMKKQTADDIDTITDGELRLEMGAGTCT